MPEQHDGLTRDDLVLLMESYRNMITMHQTILDQTTHTIEKLDNIATKQDSISTKQNNTCTQLGNIAKRLDDCAKNLSDSNTTVHNHSLKSIEEHGKITNKVYIGWIGMGTIIVSLVGLLLAGLHYVEHFQNLIETVK